MSSSLINDDFPRRRVNQSLTTPESRGEGIPGYEDILPSDDNQKQKYNSWRDKIHFFLFVWLFIGFGVLLYFIFFRNVPETDSVVNTTLPFDLSQVTSFQDRRSNQGIESQKYPEYPLPVMLDDSNTIDNVDNNQKTTINDISQSTDKSSQNLPHDTFQPSISQDLDSSHNFQTYPNLHAFWIEYFQFQISQQYHPSMLEFLFDPQAYLFIQPSNSSVEILSPNLEQPPRFLMSPEYDNVDDWHNIHLERFLRRMLGGYHAKPFTVYGFFESEYPRCSIWPGFYSGVLGNNVILTENNPECFRVLQNSQPLLNPPTSVNIPTSIRISKSFPSISDTVNSHPLVTLISLHNLHPLTLFLDSEDAFIKYTFTYIIIHFAPQHICDHSIPSCNTELVANTTAMFTLFQSMTFHLQIMDDLPSFCDNNPPTLDTDTQSSRSVLCQKGRISPVFFDDLTHVLVSDKSAKNGVTLLITRGWDLAVM